MTRARGLNRKEAADYIGVSPCLFDRMVKDGRMPKPKAVERRLIWDREGLDRAFEALPDTSGKVAPRVDWSDVSV